MKKTIYLLLLALSLQSNDLMAQTCKNNLLTNPSFTSGINSGWTQFTAIGGWIELSNPGCMDTFVLLGSGAVGQGAIAQDVAFAASGCYDLCLCLGSDFNQKNKVMIFAATNDTSLTTKKLKDGTYGASAQLIHTVNISGTTSSYCKKGWVASKAYSRIIIMNTPQPTYSGAEVWVDNVCLSTCLVSVEDQKPFFENLSIINSDERISILFDQMYFDCEIMEITGKTVRQFTNVENVELSKTELNPGIYIVRVIKDGMVYTQKVVF